MILNLKTMDGQNCPFVSVEQSWLRENLGGYSLIFPKKFEDDARELSQSLLLQLRAKYGNRVDEFFGPDAADEADSMVIDKTTGRVTSADALASQEAMDDWAAITWIDMSLLTKEANKAQVPTDEHLRRPSCGGMGPQFDSKSLASFGSTIQDSADGKDSDPGSNNVQQKQQDNQKDDHSLASRTSRRSSDSRVSRSSTVGSRMTAVESQVTEVNAHVSGLSQLMHLLADKLGLSADEIIPAASQTDPTPDLAGDSAKRAPAPA